MLPDFRKAKAALDQELMAHFDKEVTRLTIKVPRFFQHEGDRSTMRRENGNIVETTPDEGCVAINIPKDRFPDFTLQDIKLIYSDAAERMAEQLMRSFLRTIDEAVAEAGTAVDAKGRGLDFDLFLEALDRMQLEFTGRGEWVPPTLMLHPRTWEAVKDQVTGWESPEHRDRLRQLLERKWEEWREREARRKLVD